MAGRNNIHTWWLGMLGCALFALLFHHSQLYADVVLQLFFIGISALGWWQWRQPRQGSALPITGLSSRWLGALLLLGVAGSLGYGALLHWLTDAWLPYMDSAVLAFSVIAQLLMMRRKLQSWWFWLLVNTIAVPLYASRGLHLTAVLRGMDGAGRAAYSRALVACAVRQRPAAVCPLAFGEVAVQERVKNAMNGKKPAVWAAVLLVIAAAVIAVCFLTSPGRREPSAGGAWDAETLYALRTPYVGDPSAVGRILNAVGLDKMGADSDWSFTMLDLPVPRAIMGDMRDMIEK